MFRFLPQLGVWLLLIGFLLFLPCGGLRIKGDAEGTWLFIGPLQWAGGAALLAGILLAFVGAYTGNRNPPPAN